MDLRFIITDEFSQAVQTLQRFGDKAMLMLEEDKALIALQEEKRTYIAAIEMPKDFFIKYEPFTDQYEISLKQLAGLLKAKTANLADLQKEPGERINFPQVMFNSRVKLKSADLLRVAESITYPIKFHLGNMGLTIDNSHVPTAHIDTPKKWFSVIEVNSTYPHEPLHKMLSYVSWFCELRFNNKSPLKLVYPCHGFDLYFFLAPIA